jgi:hypothetical protein
MPLKVTTDLDITDDDLAATHETWSRSIDASVAPYTSVG